MKSRMKTFARYGSDCGSGAVSHEPGEAVLDERGFTLLELFVVLVIISILVLIGIPSFREVRTMAQESRCMAEIRGLEQSINAYVIDKNTLPSDLSHDLTNVNLVDPWGHPYQYLNIANGGVQYEDSAGHALNDDFDLYSTGKDGATTERISLVPGADSVSNDDIVRASEGVYVGRADKF